MGFTTICIFYLTTSKEIDKSSLIFKYLHVGRTFLGRIRKSYKPSIPQSHHSVLIPRYNTYLWIFSTRKTKLDLVTSNVPISSSCGPERCNFFMNIIATRSSSMYFFSCMIVSHVQALKYCLTILSYPPWFTWSMIYLAPFIYYL